MEELKIGDFVYLWDNRSMAAPVGSIGKVTPMTKSDKLYFEDIKEEGLSIEWITTTNQSNGGYSRRKFRMATEEELPIAYRKNVLLTLELW